MKTRFPDRSGFLRTGLLGLASGAALLLSGCAMSSTGVTVAPVAPVASAAAVTGSVHGGQQPVAGATMQIYAVSTHGYGAAAYPLFSTAVITTSAGNFSFTGDYTCPSSSSQVYITATGGDSGSGTNPNLALMAALGSCGNLSASTFVSVNELTTVASVWALAPFMTGLTSVGTSATNVQGLVNAFAAVNKLASIGSGIVPGNALAPGATAPTTEMNTLADILASCVNSAGGAAGDGSLCGALFTATTISGSAAPKDTIAAALNMAKSPSHNVSTLFNLAAPKSPFQPTLTAAPTDWTISVTYSAGGFNKPSSAAVDPAGSLWVANAAGNSVSVLTSAGVPLAGSPFTNGGLSGPSAIAIDATGGAWIANQTSSTVTALTASGAPLASSPLHGGGLSSPTGVSIDGQGFIWITNSGNSTLTKLSADGSVLSGFGFAGGGVSSPVAVAINPQ